MEQVLEHTCRSLPYGGDHDLRAFIAERLIVATIAGRTTLGELGITARKALADYQDTPDLRMQTGPNPRWLRSVQQRRAPAGMATKARCSIR
jgi:hypothetical protein